MRAADLRQAINLLDPEKPLKTDQELAEQFVARPYSPIQNLYILLEATNEPQKILFTGHRGCGKSTELAKLAQQLARRFFILHYSVKDRLNLFDLTYVDVVLSLGLELLRASKEQKIRIKAATSKRLLAFTKEITKEVEMGVKGAAEAGAELNLLVAKLIAKFGVEPATRTVVREKAAKRLTDLLENIETLALEIETQTETRTLAIIEDLDKTDLKTAKELFYEHSSSLRDPHLSVIYTFPTALRHDNDFQQVRSNFTQVFGLPNIRSRLRNEQPDEDGLARLEDILSRRLEPVLLTPEAHRRLAEASSGIPRELIALARFAAVEARKAKTGRIEIEAVENAVASRRREYQILLTTEQLRLLERVKKTKRVENDEAHRALLHNLSALEYRNEEVWYDVHPVVEPLLLSV
ncbi:MAG: AAA family ATPase [Acidobacteria bacterium]|nr:AAA family ATPase [Acidobacteriota bacterium]